MKNPVGKWYIARLRRRGLGGTNPLAASFGDEAIVYVRQRSGRVDILGVPGGAGLPASQWTGGNASRETAAAHVQIERDPFSGEATPLRDVGAPVDPHPSQDQANDIWENLNK